MSNFDDIFDAPKAQESAYQPDAFDKEAWAAKKQAERSSAYELIDRTAEDPGYGGGYIRPHGKGAGARQITTAAGP